MKSEVHRKSSRSKYKGIEKKTFLGGEGRVAMSRWDMPATGPTDCLIAATEELTDAIANPHHASPFLSHGSDERTALAK